MSSELKESSVKTIYDVAEEQWYEIRPVTEMLTPNESFEKVIRPFDFSSENGWLIGAVPIYNTHYLYPVK